MKFLRIGVSLWCLVELSALFIVGFSYEDDLRDAIKTTAPKSPLDSLPLYSVDDYTPAAKRLSKDESAFNISISPVKQDPFTAFHR